jgi:hypothetical protein
VDVVNIASPNGFHFEQSYKVIDAGKHVVVEKPMALNKQHAEKLIFQALHNTKQVFAVMQNRYSPPSAWIKEMVESGGWENIWFSLFYGIVMTDIINRNHGMGNLIWMEELYLPNFLIYRYNVLVIW